MGFEGRLQAVEIKAGLRPGAGGWPTWPLDLWRAWREAHSALWARLSAGEISADEYGTLLADARVDYEAKVMAYYGGRLSAHQCGELSALLAKQFERVKANDLRERRC